MAEQPWTWDKNADRRAHKIGPDLYAIDVEIRADPASILIEMTRRAENYSALDFHVGGVELMCATLEALGYGEAVKVFRKMVNR